MLRQKKISTVFHDDNGSFADFSREALDFARDGFALVLSSTEDYLYFGRDQRFSAVYVELSTANTTANTLDVELYNGTSWVDVSNLIDETKGFTRSGFLQWERFRDKDDWQPNAVNLTTKFWIRIRPSADFSAGTEVKGMNILFSDDQDLKAEYPDVMSLISDNETTFVLRHQSARDDIVQDIRNQGNYKFPVENHATDAGVSHPRIEQIEAWDFLDIDEVRRWSTFLALSKIFSNVQSGQDDFWIDKAQEYLEKSDSAKKLYLLTLDEDDDGLEDRAEKVIINRAPMARR